MDLAGLDQAHLQTLCKQDGRPAVGPSTATVLQPLVSRALPPYISSRPRSLPKWLGLLLLLTILGLMNGAGGRRCGGGCARKEGVPEARICRQGFEGDQEEGGTTHSPCWGSTRRPGTP